MKKKLYYFSIFVFTCFILPAMLTNTKKTNKIIETTSKENTTQQETENNNEQEVAEKSNQNYTYTKYGTIKLLHAKTGEVEEVEIDNYLVNVVSAEMPADYEREALKAQAVVARTYTIYKILNKKHENADICDNSACCQAWINKEDRFAKWEESKREKNWQKITECVNETKGEIVTYGNQPINAFFHSNSGGTTETPVNVWGGGENYPYLQTVQTAGEEGYAQYSSEVSYSQFELINKLKTKYADIEIDFNNDEEIKIIENTESGRVRTVKFGNHNLSGVEARTLLELRSTNFQISKEDGTIKFSVKGYGHGVGMSQTGADMMAKQGSSYQDIIKHFYIGVEIQNENTI